MKLYKQTSSQGCLAVCLLQSVDEEITQKKELELLFEGLRTRSPYAVGVVGAFAKQYDKDVTIHVDNPYYQSQLKKEYETGRMRFIHSSVTIEFLDKLDTPFVVYLSTHTLLKTWDYSPHFVIIESMTDAFYTILEPWSGKRMKVSKKKMMESISELRSRVHYCPLVMKVTK